MAKHLSPALRETNGKPMVVAVPKNKPAISWGYTLEV